MARTRGIGQQSFPGLTGNGSNGSIGEYDITTGQAINANLVTGLAWFSVTAIAVSGNNLFVANIDNPWTVDEYDATSGALIKAGFVLPLETPFGLSVSGNNLFVANGGASFGDWRVSEYNATTGAAINVTLVGGLNGGIGIAAWDNDLFVLSPTSSNGSTFDGQKIGDYNASTGVAINPNLITGPIVFYSMAVASGPTSSECPPLTEIYPNDTQAAGLLITAISNPMQPTGGERTATVRIQNNLRVWLEATQIEPNPNNPLLPPPTLVADLNAGTEGQTAELGLLPPCETKDPRLPCESPGVSAWTAAFCGGGDISISFRFTPWSALVTLVDTVLPGEVPSTIIKLSSNLDTIRDLHDASVDLGGFNFIAAGADIFKFSQNQQEIQQAVQMFNLSVSNIPKNLLKNLADKLAVGAIEEALDLGLLQYQTGGKNVLTIDLIGH